jgi:hypothetical protein
MNAHPASRGLKGERAPQRLSDAMTEVIVSEFVSLDGVMEDPAGPSNSQAKNSSNSDSMS